MSDVNSLYAESEKLKDEGKLEGAVAKLMEVLSVDPNHILSLLALAVIYGRMGTHDQAVQHGEKACELEPTEAFNFTALSVTYQRAGQGTQNQDYIPKAEDAMARAQAIQGASGH